MKPKYPSMFCKPKPVISNTYLYQHKFDSLQQQQQHCYESKQQQKPPEIIEESEKPSMGGLGLALDSVNSHMYTETTIIEHDEQKLMRYKKAKSEIIFSSNKSINRQRHHGINPAAMLHCNNNNNNINNINNMIQNNNDDNDTVSCIHGHYNINYIKYNKIQNINRAKLIKSSKLNALIPDVLQYRVIQCGYITKQGKIRKNWKKRFALLLCAKQINNENTFRYNFKLLYFSDDTLSNLKGCISFNTVHNNIGLVAPKSAYLTSNISSKIFVSQHLSTPIRPKRDNLNNSLSVSISLNKSANELSNEKIFYKLLQKNPTHNNLKNIWSSFPNYNGFYIIDSNKDRIWYIDTNNFENAKKWLLSIWDIETYFSNYSNINRKLSKKLKKMNLNKINERKEIELYAENELCIKNGFSDFVSVEMEGYNKPESLSVEMDKYNTLRYMIMIPNQCHIRFKGLLLFDCIDTKYSKKNNYVEKKRFKPNFYKLPTKIRMKQKSIFIEKQNSKNNKNNAYFEIVGDLNRCVCNARNDKAKMLWDIAFTHYTNMMNNNQ